MRKAVFLLWTLSVLFLLSGCSRHRIVLGKIPPIPRPEYQDSAIIKSFAMQTAKAKTGQDLTLVSEGSSVKKIQSILNRLIKANLPAYPYHAFVIADENRNAFTDGKAVYVHSKLLSEVRSDDDLVAVVSHELAHIAAGHLSHDKKEERMREGAVVVVSAILGAVAGAAQARSYPYASQQSINDTAESVMKLSHMLGSAAFVAPYNRDQEREADEVGMMMAAKAGYNPDSFLDFWANAGSVFKHSPSGIFLDTHPSHHDRAENLRAALLIAREYYHCALEASKPKAKPSRRCNDLMTGSQCGQDFCTDARVK